MKTDKYTGIAIAIAWPEFVGKQSGSWYDTPMRWVGANKNFHYKVGHAALILVNKATGGCYHFDCGRYHAPFQYGRIRDASTDTNLTIRTQAVISDKKLVNFEEILQEIQTNKTCFGVGPLYASYCPVDFALAWNKVKAIQNRGAIPFGPFVLNGTNCCRFVRTGILAGKPAAPYELKLRYLWLFKPMPISNINCLSESTVIPEIISSSEQRSGKYATTSIYNKYNVRGTLPAPPIPGNIPPGSKWHSGEVAGSWFHLEPVEGDYHITRYSPEGAVECAGRFKPSGETSFDPWRPYSISYLSHCSKVTVLQGNNIIELDRVV